ncbi:hypothetical protein ACIO13_23735 [Streptomyces sp. NPDC087425]|uniref:hypothetical protein n=1 Tax=Streptomyces sp. NPDC087425 TaxID=3365787 RepID=UPI0037FC4EA4
MESLFCPPDFATLPRTGTPRSAQEEPVSGSAAVEHRTTPTDRARPQRQWSLFLAGAFASGEEQRTMSTADLVRQEGVTLETCTQIVRFCAEVGLFRRVGRGKFAVTKAGWAIAQHWQQDQTYARLLLQGVFRSHWSVPASDTALRSGPLPVEELGKHLLSDLPGKPRRGVYLVEWQAMAFLVHRDQQGMVWPTPALSAAADAGIAALPAAPAGTEPDQPSEQDLNALWGMTNRELDEMDSGRCCAILDNLTRLVKSTAT